LLVGSKSNGDSIHESAYPLRVFVSSPLLFRTQGTSPSQEAQSFAYINPWVRALATARGTDNQTKSHDSKEEVVPRQAAQKSLFRLGLATGGELVEGVDKVSEEIRCCLSIS
jgi:hypothetical protein